MTDETAKKQAELESDDEDEDEVVSSRQAALFRDASSSPDLPPLKKSNLGNGASATTKSKASQDEEGSATEASEASTDVFSDSEELVSLFSRKAVDFAQDQPHLTGTNDPSTESRKSRQRAAIFCRARSNGNNE